MVIGFLDDRTERPIILGKLFLNGSESDSRGFLNSNALTVKDKATLPPNTKIGDIQYSELLEMVRASEFLQEWSKYLNTGYIEANSTATLPVSTLSSIRIGNAKFIVPSPTPEVHHYQHTILLMLKDESYLRLTVHSSDGNGLTSPKYLVGYTDIGALLGSDPDDVSPRDTVVHVSSFVQSGKDVFVNYFPSGGGLQTLTVAQIAKVEKDTVMEI